MAVAVDLAALALALGVTVLEMTEVVALVFALGAEGGARRPAALGAVLGVAVVATVAAVVGVQLERLPRGPLLAGAAVTLAAFGLFLLRSTRRTYRRARRPELAPTHPPPASVPFAGGVTVGAIEATELVVVLVAIAAAGEGVSALLGALVGGGLLLVVALAVHDRVRRIKVPTLKLGATGALFTFAVFWGAESVEFPWPGPPALEDVWLLPLFAVAVAAVRAIVALDARSDAAMERKG